MTPARSLVGAMAGRARCALASKLDALSGLPALRRLSSLAEPVGEERSAGECHHTLLGAVYTSQPGPPSEPRPSASCPGHSDSPIEMKGIKLQGAPMYLDMQATTPMDPRVVDAMLPFMTEQYGNPHSRTHMYGWEAERAVEEARAQVRRAAEGAGERAPVGRVLRPAGQHNPCLAESSLKSLSPSKLGFPLRLRRWLPWWAPTRGRWSSPLARPSPTTWPSRESPPSTRTRSATSSPRRLGRRRPRRLDVRPPARCRLAAVPTVPHTKPTCRPARRQRHATCTPSPSGI